jgi:hypothetical protein
MLETAIASGSAKNYGSHRAGADAQGEGRGEGAAARWFETRGRAAPFRKFS